MRRATGVLALVTALTLAACDRGPSGPGAFEVTVSGESLGGVLLQVDGPGVRGFTALGDTRLYSAADGVRPDRHRVIAITPEGGELRLGIDVEDLGTDPPLVTVLQATRTDNGLVPPARATVRIGR